MSATMPLTLERALKILGAGGLGDLRESDLPSLRRRAAKRWHPDRIASMKPPEEVIEVFAENFRLIDDAIELVHAHLRGNPSGNSSSKTPPAPEDVLRANAHELQARLREVWPEVKAKGYKRRDEEVVISGGYTVDEILKQELSEDIPMVAMIALSYAMTFLVGLCFVPVMIALSVPGFGFWEILAILIGAAPAVYLLAGFIALLPMSRLWLPQRFTNVVSALIEQILEIHQEIVEYCDNRHNAGLAFLISTPLWIARNLQRLVFFPIYTLAGACFSEQRLGRIVSREPRYAGIFESYAEILLSSDPATLDSDDLQNLAHLYNELSTPD
ncbi:MAG: hypothetical protein ACFB21_04250 [Opitutales bacterium]